MSDINFYMNSVIDQYNTEREELIRQDRALRVDSVKLDNLTAAEAKAEQIIRAIRAEEAVSIWDVETETVPHPFPGMEFLTSKTTIQQTKIFKILSKMPKGALLHAHLDATVDALWVLHQALKYPAIHVRTAVPINAQTIKTTLPEFRVLPESEIISLQSLTDPSYPENGWVPLRSARQNFALGGPEAFDNWYIASTTVDPAEAYGTHPTVTKIWLKFVSTFKVANDLIRFQPIFESYVKEFLLTSIEDGISYVEPRINFLCKNGYRANGQENTTHREWLLVFDRMIQEVKEEMKRQGREDEFVGAKIIYSTIRFITPEELEWYTEDCIALKQEFPHLIAGFDLVGPENALKPLIDYIVPLKKFVKRQKEVGVDIPFIFHAGETLGDGTFADMNLYDAILLGTKRIGHGFSLVKHPKLMEICRERNIPLEVCPISNEVLRLTTSIPMHPLAIAINAGVPVALSSDDPAMFGNMGLTYDFYQVLVSSEITGIITLGEIARNSLEYSTMEKDEKARAIALWDNRWAVFVDDIVREGE